MSDQKDSILRRVKKMLNLANDAAASEGERDNAMRMVHSILAKHNLSMSEAEASGTSSDGSQRIKDVMDTQNYPWMRRVAFGVANLMFCEYYAAPRGNKVIHNYIGRQSNTITAKEMTEYVVQSIWKEANRLYKLHPEDPSFWTSFCNGAAVRVQERCDELRKEAERLDRADAQITGTALVLSSVYAQEELENKKFKEALGLKFKKSRGSTSNSFGGFNAGVKYGNSVSLGRQIQDTKIKGALR